MQILMFGWEFPPFNSGGLGVACRGLVRSLGAIGAAVTFVLPREVPIGDSFCRFLFADLKAPRIMRKGLPTHVSPYISVEGYTRLLARLGLRFRRYGLLDEVMRYALSVPQIIDGLDFDIIHAHDWLSFPAGLVAKRLSGKPLVVHVHATEFDRTGGHNVNQDVYGIELEGMEGADAVVAVSGYTKRIICERYGIASEKIHVVHNGIDEADYLASYPTSLEIARIKERGQKVVLYVGRLTLQKGPDYFVKAAKRVLEYMPNVYFVVSGSGDMEGRIIQEVAYLGLTDRFIFTGFLRGEELQRVYALADIFIMPSVSEPFGLTPLESLLHGTPVIISKQSGISELLFHALKVDFWDIDDMTNKIIAVLRHPPLRKTLSENGREEARKSSWHRAAEKVINVYKGFVKTPN